jgi:[protein-PII] uridylyltransferase
VADAIERAISNIPAEAPSTEELTEAPISERIANAQPAEGAVVRTEPSPGASARIRFETDSKDGSTVLTVEAVDRPGLLLAVTQALFHAGLQIVGLRATTEQGCAVDRFHLAEVDGSPLRQERLLTLQTAILGALDEGTLAPLRRSAS